MSQKQAQQPSPSTRPQVKPVAQSALTTGRGNAAAAEATRLNVLNSQRPGTPEAAAKPPDLSALARLGYTVYPIAEIDVLYAAAKSNPDLPLAAQPQGKGGYDAVLSGTFTTDYRQSAGPIVRDGTMDTQGHEKAKGRGGLAVLKDGSIVVGRAQGRTNEDVQATFGSADNPVKDFMGGGALLVEGGRAVTDSDLRDKQRFDQGGGGIHAQQMRSTHHVLVGIRDGQAFAIVATDKAGAQMQKELMANGFDAVVKFDGGSGGYARDGKGGAPEHRGVNSTGLGIKVRK